MPELKSERHHWWPVCVSEFWKDAEGFARWLLPDGDVRPMPPKNLGVIGNGHHIKFSTSQSTVWDHSFEASFGDADTNFPSVIRWLQGLDRKNVDSPPTREARLLAQPAPDERIAQLVEGIVSLNVRSPMFRNAAVSVAERFRGPLSGNHRESIIGLNLRHCQRMIADHIGTRGKFIVMFSPDREFVFGDGFYTDIFSPAGPPTCPTMLVPLTPDIAVLFGQPMEYASEPKLVTTVLSDEETKLYNDIVQVYAKDAIYYRSQKPEISEHYRAAQHYTLTHDNPVTRLLQVASGVRASRLPFFR